MENEFSESLAQSIANGIEETGIDEDSEDVEKPTYKFDSLSSQLKSLAVPRRTIERLGHLSKEIERALRKCELDLRLQRSKSLRQSTILDHSTQT